MPCHAGSDALLVGPRPFHPPSNASPSSTFASKSICADFSAAKAAAGSVPILAGRRSGGVALPVASLMVVASSAIVVSRPEARRTPTGAPANAQRIRPRARSSTKKNRDWSVPRYPEAGFTPSAFHTNVGVTLRHTVRRAAPLARAQDFARSKYILKPSFHKRQTVPAPIIVAVKLPDKFRHEYGES